ncbi:MAG TPA: peptidyl-prolyl cis-trans isomerase [Terriglobales bacterium]|nr:peptidyl-prolyl cis-trans isomerase [Terriglobales bacterium]
MIRFLQNDRGKKIFAALIVLPLIIAMVMYLGNAFTDAGMSNADGVYANVAGEKITSQQVNDAARRQARDRFPNGVPEMLRPYLNQQAANNLIMQAALVAEAHRMGLKVTDEELREYMKQGELGKALFPNGNFIGHDQYLSWVQSVIGVSAADFERDMKNQMLLQRLISVVQGGVAVPDTEVKKEFERQNVKVKFDYAVITAEDLMKKVPLSEPELKAFFDRNQASFETVVPEQRKARYAVVDPSSVQVSITEDDYKRAYAQRQEQYREAESVDVRHILVKTEAEALDIKKKLEGGAKFDDLAKKLSQDPGSKDSGGLYKGVIRNQMVPEFDKVAFSLPAGKISDPVKTSFGYHILKVDQHQEARLKPLEQVKGELEATIRAEKSATQLDTMATALENDARKEGLEKAAAKQGVKVITTDFFTQTSSLPGVGNSPQFMQEIFTLKPKSPAERIALTQGYAVVEVTDMKPANRLSPSFEEVRARVEQQFRNERATSMLNAKTQELADRAHSLNNLRAAAKEFGATVKTSELVTPTSQVPDLGAMSGPASIAFNMKPNQISDAVVLGRNGAVLAVIELQEPSPAEFETKREQVRESLVQRKRMEMLEAYAESVRSRMQKDGDIHINANEQKRLFGPLTGS